MVDHLLLIDDDKDYTFLMDCLLRKSPWAGTYKIFNDVSTAIEYLRHCRPLVFPKVIFIDINMPGKNGFVFLEVFKEEFTSSFSDSRVYMLSGSVKSTDRQRALKYAFVKDVLMKPVSSETLKDVLGNG